ncbi:MAG: DUF951 domain-containing protein [Anaerolineaceae bacterium]|nr:DUF951 domain-containing protein [Anaerolineaceae bacterium]
MNGVETNRWEIGAYVRLRKRHPCGEDRWRIYRLGADIGLRCCGCGRRVLLPRARFLRQLREVLPETEVGTTCAS